MRKKLTKNKALKLIGSYAYDIDIPINIRMETIVSILKEMGIDYSYDEEDYAKLV